MILTPKQLAFVEAYLICLNATEAARRAQYKQPHVQGPRLLANVRVMEAIQGAMQKRSEATGVTAEQVVNELARIAFADIRKLYKPDGSMKPPSEWSDEEASIVASLDLDELFEGAGQDKFQKGHTKKIKRWDKVKALELLGRHLGMFIDRHEHSGPGGGPIPVETRGQLDPAARRAILEAGLRALDSEGGKPAQDGAAPGV